MDTIEELLKLYCHHSTAEIEAADGKLLLGCFNVEKPEDLFAIQGYNEAFSLISVCASSVDKLTIKYPNANDQVRASLRMLRRMFDEGEHDT